MSGGYLSGWLSCVLDQYLTSYIIFIADYSLVHHPPDICHHLDRPFLNAEVQCSHGISDTCSFVAARAADLDSLAKNSCELFSFQK